MSRVDQTLLTPLLLLERSAYALPNRVAIVHDDQQYTYKEMAAATTRLARALQASGIEPGDRVAYLLPNIPEMLIGHFGVPLAHAVLVAINFRLSSGEIEYILNHSGAKLLVVDTALMPSIAPIRDNLETVEEIIFVNDAGIEPAFAATTFAEFLERGSDEPLPWTVDDEDRTISINYTSGTTGRPKGVMYSHRGAYLNSLGEIIHSRHTRRHCLSLDAADVPCQWLVHDLGRNRHRRHPHLLAGRRRRRHLAANQAPRRHPSERCSDSADHDRQLSRCHADR